MWQCGMQKLAKERLIFSSLQLQKAKLTEPNVDEKIQSYGIIVDKSQKMKMILLVYCFAQKVKLSVNKNEVKTDPHFYCFISDYLRIINLGCLFSKIKLIGKSL